MAAKTPWMPFYVNDWFGSMTRNLMTPAQRAGYLELLFHQWGSKEGALPNDERTLGALSGMAGEWEVNKDMILPCFPPHPTLDGYVANPRCTELIEEKKAKAKTNSESGKKGAEARWGTKDDIANAKDKVANANENGKTAIVSPSEKNGQSESESESYSDTKLKANSDTTPRTTIAAQSSGGRKSQFSYPDSFTAWWEAYPKERRKGKKKTFDAWKTAGGRLKDEHNWDSQVACDYLQERVEEFAASPAAKRVKYVKDAHRWLEHGQYDDDPAAWGELSNGSDKPKSEPFDIRKLVKGLGDE